LHSLQESFYVGEAKPAQQGPKGQANYELKLKAHLATFLRENDMQDILDQATEKQTAHILLTLLNVFLSKKDKT
jgi:hypothetical protein